MTDVGVNPPGVGVEAGEAIGVSVAGIGARVPNDGDELEDLAEEYTGEDD